MISRRAFLSPLLLLGAGAIGYIYFRDQFGWPQPQAVFRNDQGHSGWLKLPPMRSGLELPARVHGLPVNVLIDSGAQYTAIDRGLSERLGLRPQTFAPIVAYGVSGGPSVTRAVDFQLDLGPVTLNGLRGAVLELAPLSAATGGRFNIIMGRDALRALTADIDFPHQRVAFSRPDVYAPPAGAVSEPVRMENGALMAKVAVEDSAPIELLVDTGASTTLALSRELATRLNLLDGREVTQARSVTLGGIGLDQVVRVERLTFAGLEIRNAPVSIFQPPTAPLVPQGLLGVGVLRRFRAGLDHANGQLFLSRAE